MLAGSLEPLFLIPLGVSLGWYFLPRRLSRENGPILHVGSGVTIQVEALLHSIDHKTLFRNEVSGSFLADPRN